MQLHRSDLNFYELEKIHDAAEKVYRVPETMRSLNIFAVIIANGD